MYSHFILAVLGLAHTANALSLPVSVYKRDQISDDTFEFREINNISQAFTLYTADISVNGKNFSVLLDTGSSDLWVDTSGVDLSGFVDTGIQSAITYADLTGAAGPVLIGNVGLGTFSPRQAFISAPGANATAPGKQGILGIGPPPLSLVRQNLDGSRFDGSSFFENVFADNPSLGRFYTFALSRSEAAGSTEGGIFTVGEVAANLTAVTRSVDLPIVSNSRWITLMDGMIVNGKTTISGFSVFPDVPRQQKGQTLANLDTGTNLAFIPKTYADAIYGSIPGSMFDASSGFYFLPCDTKINVSLVFGGVEYPVHPIDTVQALQTKSGSVVCVSGFIARDTDPVQNAEDFLLGDTFLRNVYTSFNFGSFMGESTPPSIQLLSTTDADAAYAEFDKLSAQRNQSIVPSAKSPSPSQGSPTSPSDNKNNSALSLTPTFYLGWATLAVVTLLA